MWETCLATYVRFACLLFQDQEAAQGIARLVLDSLRGDDPVIQAQLLIALGSHCLNGGREAPVLDDLRGDDLVSRAQLPRMCERRGREDLALLANCLRFAFAGSGRRALHE